MSLHHVGVILALLVPLSLDTFLLSATLGLAGLPQRQQLRTSLIFTFFDAVMPIVGVLIGQGIGHVVGHFAGYIAPIVIGLAGLIALKPGKDEEQEQRRLKLLAHTKGLAIIGLGLSISVDELAIGVSLGLLRVPLLVAIVFLGMQSFIASQLGLRLGGRLNETVREVAERFAGLALVIVALVLVALKLAGHEL